MLTNDQMIDVAAEALGRRRPVRINHGLSSMDVRIEIAYN